MKTFTFRPESDKDAELLKELSDRELNMLHGREADFLKSPSSAINAEELEAKLKSKYGF